MGNSAQREQLKAIGTRLREERQKKSMPLEEIAVKTYIPQRLMIALEEANLDRLPEPVFVQDFIRRYADAIGLDGSALSKEFTIDLSPLPAPSAATLITATPQSFLKPVVQAPASSKPAVPIPPAPAPKLPEPKRLREQPKVKVDVPVPKETSRLPFIALRVASSPGVIGVLAAALFNRPPERPAPTTATAGVAQSSQAPIFPRAWLLLLLLQQAQIQPVQPG
jgi:cytoskeleton protein RodZ